MRKTVSNPREFMHATQTCDLGRNPMPHLNPHAFSPLFLSLNFSCCHWIFFYRAVLFLQNIFICLKKISYTICSCFERKFNDLQVFIDDSLWLSTVLQQGIKNNLSSLFISSYRQNCKKKRLKPSKANLKSQEICHELSQKRTSIVLTQCKAEQCLQKTAPLSLTSVFRHYFVSCQ